jgi:glycosyltransferase involved in cell wall biosynthesis
MDHLTIVHVSTQRGWRGGEEQARLLVQGLVMRGHRCVALARSGGAFAGKMNASGCEVFEFAGNGRGLRALWLMRSRLREIKPDVIHFHDPHAISSAGLAAWRLPIRARIAARRVDFPIRSTWRYRWLTDRVIAVSNAVAKVCQNCGLDPAKLRVVHDGVDPSRGRSGDRQRGRRNLELADDAIALLCVAMLTDHKGHTYLLKAMSRVLAQIPQVQLILAGDGELQASLTAEAQSLGISHAVTFLGFRSDVPDLLKAADLFVMPSHLEGLCSSLIDVMFTRLPIVATTAGGIPELLGAHELDGEPVARLVPPRDPAALAEAIIASLKNPKALQSQIDRAEHRAARFFTADHAVEKTLQIYSEMLQTAWPISSIAAKPRAA